MRFDVMYFSAFMSFVWFLEQIAINFQYGVKWMISITGTESVYCAVRTGCLYIIPFGILLERVNVRNFCCHTLTVYCNET